MQLDSSAHISNENRIGPTPVTDLCKRVRFRQSECRICADICPTNAISLPLGPELSDTCINCGLCQIACPTEAFEGMYSTDQMLLDLLRDPAGTIVHDHKLNVHCHQAKPDNLHSVAVNCLGNMTENALLAMANNGVQQLMLTTGKCSGCQLSQGRDLFKRAETAYSELTTGISQSSTAATISIRTKERQKVSQPSVAPSRRDFFRSIGAGVAKQAVKVVANKEQQIRALLQTDDDTIVKKRPSPRREMLKELLTEQLLAKQPVTEKWNETFGIPTSVDFPWKKMLVDVAHCVACGVCVNVCPTGALVKEVDELELTRTINHSLCTNCGVCAEACPQDVISFEQSYNVADIVSHSDEVVAKVALNACIICGEIIPSSEGEVCTTCQKRQVVPMFM